MDIINKDFRIGERYKGTVNGGLFSVVKVGREHKEYAMPNDRLRVFERDVVTFRSEKSGLLFPVEFRSAQRLLLEKVS